MDKIDVIVPCYIVNEELLALTASTFDSLGDVNLIVIDNGSPMGGGYLRSKADIYVRLKENKGFAHAVNIGLQLSKSKLVAISNNDIRVSPNWQSVAREALITDQVYSLHFRMINYNEPFKYGDKIAYGGMERWCTSSFFVLNTASMKFFYDEEYGIGGYEDYDNHYSVHLSGLTLAYTTKACYQHAHSSTQNALDQKERKLRDGLSREYFKDKWGEYPDELFKKLYPDQYKKDYYSEFNNL